MPSDDDLAERLRELHDAYVWQVNAAVGEDREDLVWKLADEYLDEAMQLMTEGHGSGCVLPDCPVCSRPPAALPQRTRRTGWLARLFPRRPPAGAEPPQLSHPS